MSTDNQDTIRCVNCGINLNRMNRQWIAEESEELRQLLTDWICKKLEDNDALCSSCYTLIHSALESENKSRRFGHKMVCLSCGVSVNRARKSPSLSEHPELKLVITQWIPSHQVKRLELVCWKCYSKAKRLLEKNYSGIHHKVQSKHTRIKSEDIEVKLEPLGDGEIDIPASPDWQEQSSEEEEIPDKDRQPYAISLDNFRRAADTSSRCIFKNCRSSDRLVPPRHIKERLLLDYSFYLPTHSRICKQHRINSHEKWKELVTSTKISDFTAAHIENLISILQNIKCNSYCKNFLSQIRQDDCLCQYFLGIRYETYEDMVKDMQPFKKRVWCVNKALAMYLMKKHTGFSADKVANFFGVRLKLFVKIMHRVHAHLETVVASDDSYVAIPIIGIGNKEEIVYYKI